MSSISDCHLVSFSSLSISHLCLTNGVYWRCSVSSDVAACDASAMVDGAKTEGKEFNCVNDTRPYPSQLSLC
jgi:hypothetical protein